MADVIPITSRGRTLAVATRGWWAADPSIAALSFDDPLRVWVEDQVLAAHEELLRGGGESGARPRGGRPHR